MKLKTSLFFLLLLVAAAYGGAHYYLHLQIKEKLAQLERLVYPHVEFTYGKISSDLRGTVQVDNISLKSSTGATLQIESVALEGPGPRFLWDLVNNFQNSQPPESLVLKLRKVWFPVGQNFIQSLQAPAGDKAGIGDDQTLSCTLPGLLSHSGLEKLGIESMVANSVIGYKMGQSNTKARVFLEYELQGVEAMSLALSLDGIPKPGAVISGVLPSVANLDLNYSLQSGYIQRLVKHCAQSAGISKEQFLDSIFDQPDKKIATAIGFAPGTGIKQMLRKLISNGGTVQLSANPAADLDVTTLSAYKPEDILRLLKVKVALDDQPVTDLSFELIESGEAPTSFGLGEVEKNQRDATIEAQDEETEPQHERFRMRYVETRISDLHNYIGSRVKLHTRSSSIPKQGLLALLNEGVFSVEQSIHGGKMTAYIRLSDISKAEVLRLVP